MFDKFRRFIGNGRANFGRAYHRHRLPDTAVGFPLKGAHPVRLSFAAPAASARHAAILAWADRMVGR